MADISLNVKERETGKSATQRLRRENLIPAIIYGKGKENVPIGIDAAELKKALTKGGGINTLLHLNIDGKKKIKKTAIVKDIQRDPVSLRYRHVDFFELELTKEVEVEVPILFSGKAEGLQAGGIVQPVIRAVKVKCFPNKIPAKIEVDITPLNIGDSLKISDIKVIGEYTILLDAEDTIVTVNVPKEEVVEAPVAPEGEAAEGGAKAEGEAAAEGEKPAEGAGSKEKTKDKKEAPKGAPAKKEDKK